MSLHTNPTPPAIAEVAAHAQALAGEEAAIGVVFAVGGTGDAASAALSPALDALRDTVGAQLREPPTTLPGADDGVVLVAAVVTAPTPEALDHARREVALSGAAVRFYDPVATAREGDPALAGCGGIAPLAPVLLGLAAAGMVLLLFVRRTRASPPGSATRRWFNRVVTGVALGLSLDALVSVAGRLTPPEALPVGPMAGKMASVDGIWTYFLQGNATQLGHDVAVLTGSRQDAMESSAEGEFRKHVPFGTARYALTRLTPVLARRMITDVPTSMLQEIDGGAVVGEDPLGWVAPRYTRKVCLHALHDLGQAMVDAPWVQGCTGFVAGGPRTVDGHWLLGRNWDFDGGRFFDEDKAVIVERRDGAIPFVHVAIPGLVGAVSGVNAEQIGVAVLAAASDAPIRLTTPMIFIIREILESARSLEDVGRILDDKRGFVAENILAVDGRRGAAAVFEVTPDDVTRLDADGAMAVSNHLRGPHAPDHQNLLRMAEGTTVPRLARMEELLAEPGLIDVDRSIRMLTDTRAVGGGPLPAGHEHALNARNTSHSVLIDATAMQIYVSRYPNLDGGFVRFSVADLLDGRLVGERASGPVDPDTAFRVHVVRDLVRAHADDPVAMERALRLNPGDPDATLALARIRGAEGNRAAVRALLEGFVPERASQERDASALLGAAGAVER